MEPIDSVLLVSGTHGNELSGIYLHHLIQQDLYHANRSSFTVEPILANPLAIEKGVRYVDQDLNRQFSPQAITQATPCNEVTIAQQLRATYANQPQQMVIDLHNTTSNMGATLILLSSSPYYKKMGAYVKQHMPDAYILFEDQITWHEQAYLCSLGDAGVMIEVGAQAHGALQFETLELMKTMLTAVLDYIDLANQNALPALNQDYDGYFYLGHMTLPVDESGVRTAMVHPNLNGRDFEVLRPGEPMFITLEGDNILWDKNYDVYPHFINEAAYCLSHVAMELAEKRVVSLK
ncbi:aspartoacylase [Vibrio palustris]|uniref:Aspartoacylase n=1 Tax=Vibrio palustris TaxID=1918946 RepID=A0A1R4B5N5_9VIBR|nr:aspartoacylase [Vibrio palustris]SJL84225.1 aspartoacylase [Vibrio palustris]